MATPEGSVSGSSLKSSGSRAGARYGTRGAPWGGAAGGAAAAGRDSLDSWRGPLGDGGGSGGSGAGQGGWTSGLRRRACETFEGLKLGPAIAAGSYGR